MSQKDLRLERQRQVALFVFRFRAEHGHLPTAHDVAEGLELPATMVAHDLQALRKEGVVPKVPSGRRIKAPRHREEPQIGTTEQHQEIVDEADRRLARLMPALSDERRAEVAEAVAKAVERRNAVEESTA